MRKITTPIDMLGHSINGCPNMYEKPLDGIPESDLSKDVQSKLSKANTSVQPSTLNGYAEQWTFTLDNGTTVKKNVLVKK